MLCVFFSCAWGVNERNLGVDSCASWICCSLHWPTTAVKSFAFKPSLDNLLLSDGHLLVVGRKSLIGELDQVPAEHNSVVINLQPGGTCMQHARAWVTCCAVISACRGANGAARASSGRSSPLSFCGGAGLRRRPIRKEASRLECGWPVCLLAVKPGICENTEVAVVERG